MTVTLLKFDDIEPTHTMRDVNVPNGQMWQMGGYIFAACDVVEDFGPTDSTVEINGRTFPAWIVRKGEPAQMS